MIRTLQCTNGETCWADECTQSGMCMHQNEAQQTEQDDDGEPVMSITEYKERVIDLFQSGKATVEQWREMAQAVLDSSEDHDSTPLIDSVVAVAKRITLQDIAETDFPKHPEFR